MGAGFEDNGIKIGRSDTVIRMARIPVQLGYLDDQGHPALHIAVYGVVEAAQQQFDAMIDTGFTGFLLIPLRSAFPLTLTLMGSAEYELADGRLCSNLLAHGSVIVDGETVTGVITLEENHCGLLLGMDFLRKAQRALWVHEGGALLVDSGVSQTITRTILEQLQ